MENINPLPQYDEELETDIAWDDFEKLVEQKRKKSEVLYPYLVQDEDIFSSLVIFQVFETIFNILVIMFFCLDVRPIQSTIGGIRQTRRSQTSGKKEVERRKGPKKRT